MRSTPTGGASGPPLDMSKQRLTATETMRRRLAARSPAAFRFYVAIFERMLRKEFHAVRVANLPEKSVFQRPQLVIYTNHPSWWEGVIFLFLAHRLMRGSQGLHAHRRRHGRALWLHWADRRLRRRAGTPRRARCISSRPAASSSPSRATPLLVTAQGRFADCRERPLKLEAGIAHIAEIAPGATYLPLAIEYTHWLEKQPELLLRFGEPIPGQRACRPVDGGEAGAARGRVDANHG